MTITKERKITEIIHKSYHYYMKFAYFASWEVGSRKICHQTSTLFTGALATPSMDLWSHDMTGSVKANTVSCKIFVRYLRDRSVFIGGGGW